MTDLFIPLVHFVHLGFIPQQTVVDWLHDQLADARSVLIGFAGVAVLGLSIWRLVKSGFAIGSLIMCGVVAAVAIWLIAGGGIDTIAALLSDQAANKK